MTDNRELGRTAIVDKSKGRLLPVPRLTTILSILIIIFLVYAFFSKLTLQFYASFLFLFYSWTKKMWVSVVMLGIFQTIIMIPFRITNLLKSANLKEFRDTIEKIKIEGQQEYFLKKRFEKGGRIALYYVVNFFFATVSYTSIGRLFLTDFYNLPLDSNLLYSFVSYPNYPIESRIFKLPYAWFSSIRDFGWDTLKWVWLGLVVIQIIIYVVMYFSRKNGASGFSRLKRLTSLSVGNLVLFLIVSWYLVRHFPVGWSFRIFSGDVSIPNRTLNTITAVATFFTLIWNNLPKIRKKISLAKAAGYDKEVIRRTEKELFQETLKVATVVGLGAFYITNLIPSAFELSIFTLEIISWTSPLTLDKLILSRVGKKEEKKKVIKSKEKSDQEEQKNKD